MKATYGFSRRGPDHVAEEVARILSNKTAYEFKALFLVVHANLKARNMAGGGEEMLRLRAYEKLQNLVASGIVAKNGKEYMGVPAALATFFATAEELNSKFANRGRVDEEPKGSPSTVVAPPAKRRPKASKS